jgi:hypothetical protein
MRTWIGIALFVAVVAGCGSSKQAATTAPAALEQTPTAAPVAVRPRGRVDVRITAQTHTPKVQTPWHYSVHVTAKGKPVPATVSVVVLYQGAPALDLGSHAAPHGVWSGVVRWPAATRAKLVVVNAQAVSKGRDGTDQFPVAGQ